MSEYIEREALLRALSKEVEYDDDGEQEINSDTVFITIEGFPAADVADVVHGEWVFTNAGWKCNICGHSMPYWPVASTQERTNYCPNCGCKMEKEDET